MAPFFLSRLASNITVPIYFAVIRRFYLVTKVFLYFGKNSLFSRNVNVTHFFVCSEVLQLLMKVYNGFWLWFINDMCLNEWKCVGVGIIKNGSVLGFWLWELICKFQSTFVVITDFLCGKSIFPYSYTNFWSSGIYNNIICEIITGSKSTRDKWLLFLIHFPLALFAEGALPFKNPVLDLFSTVSFISLCRIWLHFGSDAAGSGCAV